MQVEKPWSARIRLRIHAPMHDEIPSIPIQDRWGAASVVRAGDSLQGPCWSVAAKDSRAGVVSDLLVRGHACFFRASDWILLTSLAEQNA